MKRKVKGFAANFMAVLMALSLFFNTVQAEGVTTINVELNRINVTINGIAAGTAGMDYALDDGTMVPFSILYNDTTYLPIRKVAELLGMDVSWDETTSTAGINTRKSSESKNLMPSALSNATQQSIAQSGINTISVEFNKINIAINGVVVGKAGMNYTLPNGKQVPYSILYKGTTICP